MPSVSIVVLTRNRPVLLIQALRSVASQTHPELELVLVRDGGAPLPEEAHSVLGDLEFPAILLEHDEEPHGVARARNRGIGQARGDAFAILDDDDRWEPDHVSRLAAALDRDAGLDVAYSDVRLRREDDGQERVIARDFELRVFARDGYIPPSAMLLRRSAVARFGEFDPSFTYSEDWEWLLRVAKGGGKIARVPGITATVLIHAGAHSALELTRLEERKKCLARLSEKYELGPLEPKTFWEVAETVCPSSVTTF